MGQATHSGLVVAEDERLVTAAKNSPERKEQKEE